MLRRTRNEKILKTEPHATKVHGVSQMNPYRSKEQHSLKRAVKKQRNAIILNLDII
jgi:hypothetical protein